jgi:hypothetical protein
MKPTKQLQTLVKWLKAGSCGVFCHSVEAIICLFTKYVQAGRADSLASDITFYSERTASRRGENRLSVTKNLYPRQYQYADKTA